jgi:hypothetical protein
MQRMHTKFPTLTVKQSVRAAHLGYIDAKNNTFDHEDKVPVDDGYGNDCYWLGRILAGNDIKLSAALHGVRHDTLQPPV